MLVLEHIQQMHGKYIQKCTVNVHLYFCQSDELSLFSTDFYSSFLCCTVTPLSRVRGRVGIPLTCLIPPLFMYVPVPSQEPVIQWLSLVYVLHICFSFIFFT